jgi:hypothetical protein
MITVIDYELDHLERSSNQAQTASSFFWGCFGVLVGRLLTLLASPPKEPLLGAIFGGVMVVLFLATAWFGVLWRRAARNRNSAIAAIKSGGGTPERLIPVARASPVEFHEVK